MRSSQFLGRILGSLEIGEMLILTNSLCFLPFPGRRPGWQQVSELGEPGGSELELELAFPPFPGGIP